MEFQCPSSGVSKPSSYRTHLASKTDSINPPALSTLRRFNKLSAT